jgi:hypothetical protein
MGLSGKPEERRRLERHRNWYKGNINIVFEEIEFEDGNWINLAQLRENWLALRNMATEYCVALNARIFVTS